MSYKVMKKQYWTTENISNLNHWVFNTLQRALAAEKRLLKTLEGSGQKSPVLRYSDHSTLFIQTFWSKIVQQNWVIKIKFIWYDHPYCQSTDHSSCFVNAGLHWSVRKKLQLMIYQFSGWTMSVLMDFINAIMGQTLHTLDVSMYFWSEKWMVDNALPNTLYVCWFQDLYSQFRNAMWSLRKNI